MCCCIGLLHIRVLGGTGWIFRCVGLFRFILVGGIGDTGCRNFHGRFCKTAHRTFLMFFSGYCFCCFAVNDPRKGMRRLIDLRITNGAYLPVCGIVIVPYHVGCMCVRGDGNFHGLSDIPTHRACLMFLPGGGVCRFPIGYPDECVILHIHGCVTYGTCMKMCIFIEIPRCF